MKTQQKEQITPCLAQILTEYEIIPASFGWHIHKGDTYCGLLEYRETQGWQGSALNYLPTKLKEELKKFAQLSFSGHGAMPIPSQAAA